MKFRFIILSLALMTMSGYGYDRITGEQFASRSEVIGQHGMVATSHPLATQIGLMEPTGSGIGGDLFAIVWDAKEQKLFGLNASGPAPPIYFFGLF